MCLFGDTLGKADLSWHDTRLAPVHVDLTTVSPVAVAAIKLGSSRKDGVTAAQAEGRSCGSTTRPGRR